MAETTPGGAKYENFLDKNKDKIIEGSECAKDIDLCFKRFGPKYALTKKPIRVYKKTYDNGNENYCITSLIIPVDTKVHLGMKWWMEKITFFPFIFNDLYKKKCRAQKAYVENLNIHPFFSNPKETRSFHDQQFKYYKDAFLKINDFYGAECFENICKIKNDNDEVCEPGIHFFFEKEDALKY